MSDKMDFQVLGESGFLWLHRHFDDPVPAVLKQLISYGDVRQGIGVGDEGGGVQPACGDEVQDLPAAAAVHTPGLEGQVLAVHIGQGENLRPVVQGHHRYHGVGPGALPGGGEGIPPSGRLEDHIRAAMGAVAMTQSHT